MTQGPWALVPIKDMGRAKARLSAVLSPDERRHLAAAMAEDVLAVLAQTRELGGIAVVTEDPTAAQLAEAVGARIIAQGACDGHTGAVSAGIRVLAAAGHRTVLALPADVPLVTPEELSRLVAAHGHGTGFTIVPAHDRRGSNAILCTPPDAVPLAFGDDSFQPHLSAARAAGLVPKVVSLPGIGLDLDHPPDLSAFLSLPSDTCTWRLLASWGMDKPSDALQRASVP